MCCSLEGRSLRVGVRCVLVNLPSPLLPLGTPPCATLNRALGNESCDISCETSDPLKNIVLRLQRGVYRLLGCIGISGGTNITIESTTDDVVIECESFPNDIVENYDNIYVCGTHGMTFRRIQFSHCGPQSPNVFLNDSSGILFEDCLFT